MANLDFPTTSKAPAPSSAAQPEAVRLVIWDLDDTFWKGTLTEGGIEHIDRNIAIVKTLAERGIISSICSKNDFERAKAELENAHIWDYFVFPRIAWQPKGAMVASIVEASQLRPETIMFIDDNSINLNEVRHYNPAVQLAEPDICETLLDDFRFKGKNDSQLKRLNQYKVLQTKERDRDKFVDDDKKFLRQSQIIVSFHYDIVDEFDRIYELINRTNQLNFTKNRLSEDRDEALKELEADLFIPTTRSAYVKVADKYGEYGIVGFYMTKMAPDLSRVCKHFLFSCRTLNMGIEQFVFSKLGVVTIDVVGEVVAELRMPGGVDWIKVVEDAARRDATPQTATTQKKLCLRGACELDQLSHYMGYRYNIQREFPFPRQGWGVPMPAAQMASIFDELKRPEHKELMERLPGLPAHLLTSCVVTGEADTFVLSFSMEEQWSYYRYKKTGLVIPVKLQMGIKVSSPDLTTIPYAELTGSAQSFDMAEKDFNWFASQFTYMGGFDQARFRQNVADLLKRLDGKRVIMIIQNSRHGKDVATLQLNSKMNSIVEEEAEAYAIDFVRLDDLIASEREVLDARHFRREVYLRLADKVRALV